MQGNTQKLITVEYARAKLGKRAERLTDQQVSDILSMLRFICNKSIDSVMEKNNFVKNQNYEN